MNENLFEIGISIEMIVWFLAMVVSILVGVLSWLLPKFLRLRLYVLGRGTPFSFFHQQRQASLQELAWSTREDFEALRLRVKKLEQSESSKPTEDHFWRERK